MLSMEPSDMLKKIINILRLGLLFLFITLSCRSKEVNYITYYNKVNEIDSIYRMAHKPQKAIRKYKRLFKKYKPKNQERIEEYATYIKLSDKFHKNFGGQKSLYRLLLLIAPYNNEYKSYLHLFSKYGIDSLKVKYEIAEWKNNLNKQLIDSFSIAAVRDREGRPKNPEIVKKNIKKNSQLLIWTFNKFGFPSLQKIGTIGNNNVFIAMPTFITHMNESEEYLYIKDKIYKYVKSGDCPPLDYALMVDNYNYINKENTIYGFNFSTTKDSIQINRNRKTIGLPSLKHYQKIRKDFMNRK